MNNTLQNKCGNHFPIAKDDKFRKHDLSNVDLDGSQTQNQRERSQLNPCSKYVSSHISLDHPHVTTQPRYYVDLKVARYSDVDGKYYYDSIRVDRWGLHPLQLDPRFLDLNCRCGWEGAGELKVWIGRHSDNNICMRMNQNVSRSHCALDFSRVFPDYQGKTNPAMLQLLKGKYSALRKNGSKHFLSKIHNGVLFNIYEYFKIDRKILVTDLYSRYGTFQEITKIHEITDSSDVLQVGYLVKTYIYRKTFTDLQNCLKDDKSANLDDTNYINFIKKSSSYVAFKHEFVNKLSRCKSLNKANANIKANSILIEYLEVNIENHNPHAEEGVEPINDAYLFPVYSHEVAQPKVFTVGRWLSCNVVVDESSLSRVQLTLVYYKTRWFSLDGGLNIDYLENPAMMQTFVDTNWKGDIQQFLCSILECKHYRPSLNKCWFEVKALQWAPTLNRLKYEDRISNMTDITDTDATDPVTEVTDKSDCFTARSHLVRQEMHNTIEQQIAQPDNQGFFHYEYNWDINLTTGGLRSLERTNGRRHGRPKVISYLTENRLKLGDTIILVGPVLEYLNTCQIEDTYDLANVKIDQMTLKNPSYTTKESQNQLVLN